MRVAIFQDDDNNELENSINAFLKDTPILMVRFLKMTQTLYESQDRDSYKSVAIKTTVLILYQ